jgi:hypothetical protein
MLEEDKRISNRVACRIDTQLIGSWTLTKNHLSGRDAGPMTGFFTYG